MLQLLKLLMLAACDLCAQKWKLCGSQSVQHPTSAFVHMTGYYDKYLNHSWKNSGKERRMAADMGRSSGGRCCDSLDPGTEHLTSVLELQLQQPSVRVMQINRVYGNTSYASAIHCKTVQANCVNPQVRVFDARTKETGPDALANSDKLAKFHSNRRSDGAVWKLAVEAPAAGSGRTSSMQGSCATLAGLHWGLNSTWGCGSSF
jgi:hypothetical protein